MSAMRRGVLAVAVGALATGVLAHGARAGGPAFNLDFGGSSATRPDSTFGAAGGQPGIWDTASQGSLLDISGGGTLVTMGASGSAFSSDIPGAVGNDERLMESALVFGTTNPNIVFQNMTPGHYDVYVYAWAGSSLGQDTVEITLWNNAWTKTGVVASAAAWPGGQVEGETYAKIALDVLPQFNSFGITLAFGRAQCAINGIQIVPGVPAPATTGLGCLAVGIAGLRPRRQG